MEIIIKDTESKLRRLKGKGVTDLSKNLASEGWPSEFRNEEEIDRAKYLEKKLERPLRKEDVKRHEKFFDEALTKEDMERFRKGRQELFAKFDREDSRLQEEVKKRMADPRVQEEIKYRIQQAERENRQRRR